MGATVEDAQVQGQQPDHQPGEGGVEPPVLGDREQLDTRFHAQSGQSTRSRVVLSSHDGGDPGRAGRQALHRLRGPGPHPPPARDPLRPPRPPHGPGRQSPGPRAARETGREGAPRPRPAPRRPRSRRRALQGPQDARWPLRLVSRRPARTGRSGRGPWGRRGGRSRRLCRRQLDAGRRLGRHPHDAPVDGRQLGRGQGRDQPPRRQEPDRGLPPATSGGGRLVASRDAAHPRAAGRSLRGPEVRDPRRPGALR